MHSTTPIDAMSLQDRYESRASSRSMLLATEAMSNEAIALVEHIVSCLIVPAKEAKGSQVRPTSIENYRAALAPFLADLLAAHGAGRWSQLATNTNATRKYPGGETAFKEMRSTLNAHGLLEELRGYRRKFDAFGHPQTNDFRTCLRPTAKLLEIARVHGIGLEGLAVHFWPRDDEPSAPAEFIELRAARRDGKARVLPYDAEGPMAAPILADLQRLNAYLTAPGRIKGIVFTGLRRIFSNADHPDFNWQWLGRYFSMPRADQYENAKGGAKRRAKDIQIDREPVVEVDFGASHLMILHGLLGLHFDPTSDPYALPGLKRDTVKSWLTLTLGSGDPSKGGPRYKQVREAGLARYPFLADLRARGIGSLDLQYHEAEIMRLAMEDLMAQQVGFLPVHDALIVPISKRDHAVQAMHGAVRRYFTDVLGMANAPEPRIK